MKTLGIAVLVSGLVAMAIGGFGYTQDATALKLGSIELSVAEKKRVNVPLWVGVAAALAGGALLAFGSRKP